MARKRKDITGPVPERAICLRLLFTELHMWRAGWRRRSGATSSSRTPRWLVWLNQGGTPAFIPRFSLWWRWERHGLSILSWGLLAVNVPCFPLSSRWSIISSIVISLRGGKVAGMPGALPRAAATAAFKAEHVSLIQIHDHISFTALQLWVRCFLSRCHILLNVILHACTHTLKKPHTSTPGTCTLAHMLSIAPPQSDPSKNKPHVCPHGRTHSRA